MLKHLAATLIYASTLALLVGVFHYEQPAGSNVEKVQHKHCPKGQNWSGGECRGASDIRLKRDIHLLATLDNGMKIYSFKYFWSNTAYVGVMAQDLLANPAWRDAVITSPNGFYAVNYGTLGLKMVTLEEWQARGLASIKSDERLSVTKQPQVLQPAL